MKLRLNQLEGKRMVRRNSAICKKVEVFGNFPCDLQG